MVKFIVTLGFLIAFSAGLVVGMEKHSIAPAATPTTHPSSQHGMMADLNLTSQQRDQMKQIWSDVAKRGRGDQSDRRAEFRKERDEAVVALFSSADKLKYDAIQKAYQDKLAAIDAENKAAFQKAVDETMAILTPEQRTKYQEMLARHQVERGDRGPRDRDRGFRDSNRRGDDRATSQPRSEPQ
ncbi:MAG TPA: Spy/CpxP family protein refolding chaperone [Tepidisphaeraceae bacterium]|jgi:Spy/CpxP family protein refolding chaperone|nr:Spy/CpxP family protein refolding chaperone [Tepidisphaeraceae bacterium]